MVKTNIFSVSIPIFVVAYALSNAKYNKIFFIFIFIGCKNGIFIFEVIVKKNVGGFQLS
jgi:hypothetical protein